MKILHYALGFPPYRSGGLTKFCIDLMVQQAKEGHIVAMIWPGEMKIFNKKTSVKKCKDVEIKKYQIQNFEIINPLPIPFDEGIENVLAFTEESEIKPYEELISNFKPDVIHVHTLMGLHKNFLKAAKMKNIRLVFTAHDFFPICPKVTIFHQGAICDSVQTCEKCGTCNTTALSISKIKVLQSKLYRTLKDSLIVKKLRKKHRDSYLSEVTVKEFGIPVSDKADYKYLRNYYYSLLRMMDVIHYNSSVTKGVYESVFELPNNCIVSITHSNIEDNREIRNYSSDKLRIRYLGPQSGAKGYLLLNAALDKLWNQNKDFCLDVHFTPMKMKPYIRIHERYSYTELEKIFDETDILVAPSILYETFGFTVLEALSYGVPVVISGTVGAKDILADGAGIVINEISSEKLFETLQSITAEKLKKMNKAIIECQSIKQINDMTKEIEKFCYGWNL